MKWGLVRDMKCLFCHHISLNAGNMHLFFECGWSKRLWNEVMLKCLVNPICFGWNEIVKEEMKAWKGSGRAKCCKAFFVNWLWVLHFTIYGSIGITSNFGIG
jgi:hypothetical protein